MDVQVVGSGVVGLCCALELARAGRRVEVVSGAAGGASLVAAGMIAAGSEALLDDVPPPTADLWREAAALWPALAARTGIALRGDGALHVAAPGVLDRRQAAAAGLGVPVVREGPRTLAVPGDRLIDCEEALRRLAAAAREAGVTFRRQEVGVDAGGAPPSARVIAAGWGAAALTSLAPELASLHPIRGQLLRVHAPGAAGPVMRAPDVYLAPQPWGWAVGATMEVGRADLDPDPSGAADLLRAAVGLLPGLAGAAAEPRIAVRAATDDAHPLVGPSLAPGVTLAVGLRRNGWLLAPLVARLVAAYHAGDPAAVLGGRPAAAWSPARLQAAAAARQASGPAAPPPAGP